jgi:DNA-binding transcriptional ArsR family regulator
MKSNLTYISYLKVLREVSQKEAFVNIDPGAKLLLDEIALQETIGKPLSISSLMSYDTIASQATIHRKLTKLIGDGLVKAEYQDGNHRTKYLKTTKTTDKYYSILSKAIEKAAYLS